ncbi:SET domain-containing protein [Decorospora gaudefroyi]|uniref:SET domain-containing protein n=1 Tax=Decorospora gaudefroyi TaxID=184978 RepID=A0A6A5KXJ5_9PLEO|nr:SET domain-containing protein [Decorospora gaudefroyi]
MSSARFFVALLGAGAFTLSAQASSQCLSAQHLLSQNQLPLRQSWCVDGDLETESPRVLSKMEGSVSSHEPVCVEVKEKEYCIHTASDLGSGHSLSIVARPTAADAILAAFLASGTTPLLYKHGLEIRSVPDKGKGLVTAISIKKKETILLERAYVVASAQGFANAARSQDQLLFDAVVDQLSVVDQEVVMSLDMGLGNKSIENIMKTNAFACQLEDGSVGDGYICLFPSVSRINHACQPNAHARFIPKTLQMEVKALRDIGAGEEISISYDKIDLKYAERQQSYKDGWNFSCTCSLCTASRADIAGSDERRARFAQLRKMLENLTADTYDAQQIVAWEKEVMEISAREGLDVLLAADYERLAYVYAGHGMVRDAKLWAEKAKESLLEWVAVEGGPNNEVRRLDALLAELNA